ncbi:TAXI family TRAP transporter solute-binding subunit [Hydrogenophilus thermoluteolus]|uniref:C4-dicarboxylate ABC transporter n=1 Tax=Hydrogenophilus thermoluteolus TaxID=297 RepID=A0A2Z6E0V6_HYDTE|nr:TAXI family TRAP transporter solute-binding subunit [Hydrogenophilus thermoluteolus]BBD78112.1 C4-dicarboxylate ABC transporter [Hydrogenophilus thermoluteolus]
MKRREFLHSSLAALLFLVAWHAQAQGQTFVTILTGGTSGVYYPLGVALSQVVGQVLPNAKVNVQATKASAENLNLLAKGRGEVAFTLGDTFAHAWNGDAEAGFKTPLKELRTLAAIYPNYIQIVASKDSGVRSLTDLKGKRVAVGAPRSGTEINARTIFQAAGFTYDDLGKVEYVSFGESVELMKNRQLDATLISAGLGVAAVRDLAAALPIVLVPVPEAVVEKIGNPVFQSETIPAGTYEGQSEDVQTVAIRNYLATHAGVDEDLVYAITKALFEHHDALVAAHSAAKGIQLERAAKNPPAPLHPGAARYYRERGVLR